MEKLTQQQNKFVIREHEIPPINKEYDDDRWVQQWYGMRMLREAFSVEALNQHASIFEGEVRIGYALEAYAMLSILNCYPNERFVFLELGSGLAPWCLTVAGAIRHRLVENTPKECFVTALEADPTHFAWSKLHLKHNGIAGNALHGAIGAELGQCRFKTMPDPAASMGQHISDQGDITVPVITIDAIFEKQNLSHVHALHMDVQGQEVNALHGARHALSEGKIDFLVIGTHGHDLEQELKKILAPTHSVVAELPMGEQVVLPGFDRPFRSTDDGVLVFQSHARRGRVKNVENTQRPECAGSNENQQGAELHTLLSHEISGLEDAIAAGCVSPAGEENDYESDLQKGEELFSKGQVAEAEFLFMELTSRFPNRHDPWNNLGVINFSRKDYVNAEKYLSTGFDICSSDSDLAYNYMLVLIQLNKSAEAVQVGHQHIAAGGDEARVRPILDKLPENGPSPLNIPVMPTDRLQEALGFSESSSSLSANRQTPLDRWKMEIDDAPIFRYLYRNFRPQRHLEFGTWQGAGVVYCLEECDATVWTLNLPFGEEKSDGDSAYSGIGESFGLGTTLAEEWAQRLDLPQQETYRTDSFGFIGRFYLEKQLGNRVCQIYCDSTKWDTANYPEGFFDSVLVDGGHIPEVVLSDTQKALSLLRPGGLIMWHDFCPPVREKFEVVQGVMSGLEQASPLLAASLEKLFWVEPSWILVGIKKN